MRKVSTVLLRETKDSRYTFSEKTECGVFVIKGTNLTYKARPASLNGKPKMGKYTPKAVDNSMSLNTTVDTVLSLEKVTSLHKTPLTVLLSQAKSTKTNGIRIT